MLTAYHVSLPHACCPLVARRIRAQRDYHEALRAPVHICAWSHELFSYATAALGPEVWEYEI